MRAHGVTVTAWCPSDDRKRPVLTALTFSPLAPSRAAYAKRMVDVLNRAYAEEYPAGCKFTSVIPTNIYGE